MVISVRVDDRLIHGQVALVWTKELNTTGDRKSTRLNSSHL